MGVIMKKQNKYYKLIPAIALFIGLPILLWTLGDFPRKSLLKEFISIITILAFTAMLAQFYFTRHNKHFKKGRELSTAVKIHQYLGYIFVAVLLLHPFFIVLPRFFEAGVDPGDAFITLITEFGSLGVVLGLIAYGLMLVIFMTTFFRNRFHLQYRLGRMFHGYFSVLFIVAAAWHVINIGRHANTPFAIYIILMTVSGIIHLFLTYYFESKKELKNG
jgi:predicted ferric reductase